MTRTRAEARVPDRRSASLMAQLRFRVPLATWRSSLSVSAGYGARRRGINARREEIRDNPGHDARPRPFEVATPPPCPSRDALDTRSPLRLRRRPNGFGAAGEVGASPGAPPEVPQRARECRSNPPAVRGGARETQPGCDHARRHGYREPCHRHPAADSIDELLRTAVRRPKSSANRPTGTPQEASKGLRARGHQNQRSLHVQSPERRSFLQDDRPEDRERGVVNARAGAGRRPRNPIVLLPSLLFVGGVDENGVQFGHAKPSLYS